jgi:hypothetical protein
MVMLDFQPTIWAMPTISTFATQANEAREVEEKMEIDPRGRKKNGDQFARSCE